MEHVRRAGVTAACPQNFSARTRSFHGGRVPVAQHVGVAVQCEEVVRIGVLEGPQSKATGAANEALSFALELFAVACLCWWGFAAGDGTVVHLLLGIGLPARTGRVGRLRGARLGRSWSRPPGRVRPDRFRRQR
ncbi:YrdB family protein [Streptomyces sp. NPDC048445]|uniref:YrdB family protein n=1 Tax=Streptomyces sp. NPDC048445 TaxID=3365553 RepID=UPI0037198C66